MSDLEKYRFNIQNITINHPVEDQLKELGNKSPYHRFIDFPTLVGTTIEKICPECDKPMEYDGAIYRGTSGVDGFWCPCCNYNHDPYGPEWHKYIKKGKIDG